MAKQKSAIDWKKLYIDSLTKKIERLIIELKEINLMTEDQVKQRYSEYSVNMQAALQQAEYYQNKQFKEESNNG
jgi:hypothetical protein